MAQEDPADAGHPPSLPAHLRLLVPTRQVPTPGSKGERGRAPLPPGREQDLISRQAPAPRTGSAPPWAAQGAFPCWFQLKPNTANVIFWENPREGSQEKTSGTNFLDPSPSPPPPHPRAGWAEPISNRSDPDLGAHFLSEA